jgi:pantetheine-phosphate adenylyltransferase
MTKIAFYPGSFDPLTYGHLDIIVRAARIAKRLVIGVGAHHGKKPLFSVDERLQMLASERSELTKHGISNIEIVSFDNLAVDAARTHGAGVIIRGLRDAGDFDYEMQMAGMNSGLAGDIETVFLASSPKVRHIAASLVRQIAAMGGDVSPFVPICVVNMLEKQQASGK